MKIKLKEKHLELGRHFTSFVDKRWFPNYVLDDESLEIFIRIESYGQSSCTEEELKKVKPLLNGKINKELTIKLLMDEMGDWWSANNGWFYPIAQTIYTEMWHHGEKQRDRVYIKALVKIMRACHKDGFQKTMIAFTGMEESDKIRYLNRWNESNKK